MNLCRERKFTRPEGGLVTLISPQRQTLRLMKLGQGPMTTPGHQLTWRPLQLFLFTSWQLGDC